jgi:hypothetical protein
MNKTVSFKSHRDLIKNLGESDAIVEFTEVAVRLFIAQANESGSFNNYLSKQSEKYSIRVNSVEQSKFRQNISKGYIITISQNMEQFFKALQIDYLNLFEIDWKFLPDGMTRLDFILGKLKAYDEIDIDKVLVSIFKYYSYIRNSYAHGGDRDHDKEFKGIQNYLPDIKERYGLNAPNHFDNITFDDFVLFTRASKDLAHNITKNAYNKVIENNLVCKYIVRKQLSERYPRSAKRGYKALVGFINTEFGLGHDYANHVVSLCPSLH